MSFAQRLDAALTRSGMTPTDLSRAIGVSRQSVSYWKSGRNEPKPDVLLKVSEALNTSALWLKTGDVSENATVIADTTAEAAKPATSFADYAAKLVCIDACRLVFEQSDSGVETPIWKTIPGHSIAVHRDEYESKGINPDDCKIVTAPDDSMAPRIVSGDEVIFVCTPENAPISDGSAYVISYGGAMRIRRLIRRINGDLVISCDNQKTPAEVISAADAAKLIHIHGRVIKSIGAL